MVPMVRCSLEWLLTSYVGVGATAAAAALTARLVGCGCSCLLGPLCFVGLQNTTALLLEVRCASLARKIAICWKDVCLGQGKIAA